MAADPPLARWARTSGRPHLGAQAMGRVFSQQMRLDRWIRRAADRAAPRAPPALVPPLLAEVRAFLFPRRPARGPDGRLPPARTRGGTWPPSRHAWTRLRSGARTRDRKRVAKYLDKLRGDHRGRAPAPATGGRGPDLLLTTGSVRKLHEAGTPT